MLLHDIHIHTKLSLCADREKALPDSYIRLARTFGISTIGFSDHFWDEKVTEYPASDWYAKQNYPHICEVRDMIAENTDGLRVLFGCETEFCMGRFLGITEERAHELDYVLVPHSHTHMHGFTIPKETALDPEAHAAYLLESFRAICNHPLARFVTSIAHPFHPVCAGEEMEGKITSLLSDNELSECFELAASKKIGIEINQCAITGPVREPFSKRMFRLAKEAGCRFSLGSDCHSPEKYTQDKLEFTKAYINDLGLTEHDFVDLVRV